MDVLKIIGKNIKYYRQKALLSQERLAELCGLHRTYVGAVERGERNISALNIEKISIALKIEPYRLLKEHSNES
ncbi:MAG: helix-turn-helix domain-containing protein [Desulfobaccales bacterium]